MSVAIDGAVGVSDRGVTRRNPAAEVHVVCSDSSVDDVGRDTRASLVVAVTRVQRQSTLVDAIETPWRALLIGLEDDERVLLDAFDPRILVEPLDVLFGELSREAIDGLRIDIQDIDTSVLFVITDGTWRYVIFQRDDVLPANRSTHQVTEVWAKITIVRLGSLCVHVIEDDRAIRLDDENISVALQSRDVAGVEFGHESVHGSGEHVADGISEARLLGDLTLDVRAVLEHDDVVIRGSDGPDFARHAHPNRHDDPTQYQRDDAHHQRSPSHAPTYRHAMVELE